MQTNVTDKETDLRDTELDEEVAGILIAISVVAKRLAQKLLALKKPDKPTMEGGNPGWER